MILQGNAITPTADTGLPLPTTDGLVAYYPLTGTAEDKQGTYDGTENGGLQYVDDAERGAVANFDGVDDYVSVPTSLFTAGQSFTVGCWIYEDDFNSDENSIIEVSGGTYPNDFVILMGGGAYSANTDARLYMRNYLTNALYVDGRNLLTHITNTWRYLVMTYDGSTLIGYQDGEILDSGTILMSNPLPNISSINIGASAGQTRLLDGRLSDLRIYNRALTEAEITDIYNYELVNNYVPVNEGLVAYYPLESNSMDNWYNQYDGTNYGVTYDGTSASFSTVSNDRITTTLLGNFSGNKSYSVTGWAYIEENTGPYNTPIVATNSSNSVNSGFNLAVLADNRISLRRGNSSTYDNLVTPTSFQDSWVFWVCTYNGSTLFFSVMDYSVSIPSSLSAADGNLYFGCFNTSADTQEFFTGKQSNVRIYDRAITEAEVTEIYNTEKSKFGL